MEMKQFLIEIFKYNDYANKLVLKKIAELPEKEKSIIFFSHLINSQNKWMARIKQDPNVVEMSWWDPVYKFDELEEKWDDSLLMWLDFLSEKTEQQLFEEIEFTGFDGGRWTSPLKDIPLQLNFHSVHHRAQIQTLIREQGFEPDFVDYIGTKYKKIS